MREIMDQNELSQMLESRTVDSYTEILFFAPEYHVAVLKSTESGFLVVAVNVFYDEKTSKVAWDWGHYYSSNELDGAVDKYKEKTFDCNGCVIECIHKDALRRLPRENGGLGLCKRN